MNRATASSVARWLLAKGKADDAVAILSAWAASGPNDSEGQALLAEALRADPSSKLAQMAFERMEHLAGTDQSALDAAILKWNGAEIDRLEKEMSKPNFRKAQIGFNNNVKYKGLVYHVQTEDSGLDKPHIITHVFGDGGRIIKSHKRSYANEVNRPDVTPFVRALMKGQHMEMAVMLREGSFDEVIAGKAMGGMETLEHEPRTELQKLATKKEDRAEAASVAEKTPSMPPPPVLPGSTPAMRAIPRFRLTVMRSLSGGPDSYEPPGDGAIIGRDGAISLLGEKFCHRREAQMRWIDGRLWLHDLEQGNGVFLRIRKPVELEIGDEFIVGDQLLAVERNPEPNDGPDPDPTYFYSSPKWPSSFRVVQIFEGGSKGACVVARGAALVIGSSGADVLLKRDPLVSEQHCMIEEQAGSILLTDLGSRTGVFVRVKGEQEIVQADEIVVGRTRLLVEFQSA